MAFQHFAGFPPGSALFSRGQNSQFALDAGNAGSDTTAGDANDALDEGYYTVKQGLSDSFGAAFDVLQDAPDDVQEAVHNTYAQAKSVIYDAFRQVHDAVANALG